MPQLELESVVGFGGKVPNGLLCHPDGVHLIYPLGSTIVVKNTVMGTQTFLKGHSNMVSCMELSRDGTKLASGQVTHMGFLADTIIWDFSIAADRAAGAGEGKSGDIILQRLSQHKVKVQDLSFSPNGKYIVTLGGQDDNQLLLWSVNSGRCLCGTPAANDASTCVAYFNNDNDRLITCGNYNLRVWEYGKESRKLIPVDVSMGQVQRVYKSVAINAEDTSAFVGTMSGDLFEIDLRPKVPTFIRASKEKFSQGIVSITLPARGVLIGTGAGVVAGLGVKLKTVCKAKLLGGVTSIAPVFNDGELAGLYMGTNQSNIYFSPWNANARTKTISPELRASCHFNPIKDIVFPQNYSRVFITTAGSDIRVWNALDRRELLRIQVPNLECHCINLTADGSLILSGWSDGKVRAFYPESGSVKFVIHDAHALGVTAVNATSRGDRVITGGADGKVRFWDVNSLKMISSLSEHKTKIEKLVCRRNDEELVSASADGSCIVWDMARYTRNNAMFASTLFRSALYHPDESQILTCGSDRKLTYWDAFDGSAIRILEGSTAEINTIDVTNDGAQFVSAGNDKQVKLWDYDEGICRAIGEGHSGYINQIMISPDQKNVVSVGAEGAIFIWKMPSRAGEGKESKK